MFASVVGFILAVRSNHQPSGVVSAPSAVAAADLLRAKGDRLLQLSPVAQTAKSMKERWAAMN